jgi:hypothetical protein
MNIRMFLQKAPGFNMFIQKSAKSDINRANSAFRILPSTRDIPHSAFRIPHSALI